MRMAMLKKWMRAIANPASHTLSAKGTASANTTLAHSSSPISDLLVVEPGGSDLLFLGPTTECVCGNNVFHALIWFNEDREIGGYFTEMACAFCGSLIRGATAADKEVLPSD